MKADTELRASKKVEHISTIWSRHDQGYFISRLEWVDNEDGTLSVVEQHQHPKADKVLKTISEHDYFLLVLEGRDRDYLHEVYMKAESEEIK